MTRHVIRPEDRYQGRGPNHRVCGAKTRRGTICQFLVKPGKRCKFHGGASTGPKDRKKVAERATKHGLYAKGLTDEELRLRGTIAVGEVNDELILARIHLRRVLLAQEKWEEAREQDAKKNDAEKQAGHMALTMIETAQQLVAGSNDPVSLTKAVRKLPDFQGLIDRWLARIGSLERTKAELEGKVRLNDGGDNEIIVSGGLPDPL